MELKPATNGYNDKIGTFRDFEGLFGRLLEKASLI